ncbi:MAG TPA: TlpA disulfide reductase family protein [Pirellulales bacterium]|nr:TlpA disulfide reductase family protein [Pirellulales bacterium]
MSSPAEAKENSKNAQKILDQMSIAYRDASSYADAGKLSLTYVDAEGKKITQNEWDYSLTLARPNKIRLQCYDAMVVSDGKELHAAVRPLPLQVLAVPVGPKLDKTVLFSDEQLNGALSGGPVGAPLVLALLVDPDQAQDFFRNAAPPVLLTPEKIEGSICDRVQLDSSPAAEPGLTEENKKEVAKKNPAPLERFVFWIDRATHAIRRIAFPVYPATQKEYSAHGATDVSITADLIGARFDAPVKDEAFAFEIPRDAQLVKRLVPMYPPPVPPTNLLGKRIGDFVLYDAAGEKITRDSVAGKVAVFEFWSSDRGPGEHVFPLLQKVRDKYPDDKKVVFYAVSIDPDKVKNEDLEKLLKSWDCTLPLARDRDAQADKVFGQFGFPCRIILGPDGKMQDFEAGINPYLVAELPKTIDKLLAGENTFADVQTRFNVALKQYDDAIHQAKTDDTSFVVDIPKVDLAAKSDPAKFKLTALWKASELKGEPGNLLIVPQPSGAPKLITIESWSSIVELDLQGKVLTRHKLDLPPDAVVSYLRTAVDGKGKRYYVLFANSKPQLFMFDDQWNRLLAYPDGEKVEIADVQIADLEGHGEPMLLVGYWDTVGVQGVSLDGKRLWSNRVIQNALRLAIAGKDAAGHRTAWCVNGSEGIAPLDYQGALGQILSLPGRDIEWLTSENFEADAPSFCAISAQDKKSSIFLGLDAEGKVVWTYPIVKSIPKKPIERAVAGKLADGRGVWLLAGPDGSLHFLNVAGQLLDKFNYGAELTGMALTTLDGKNVLIVASEKGLEAWQVDMP